MLLLLKFLVLLLPYCNAMGFHRQLGFLVPGEKVTLPQNVSTSLIGLIIPDLNDISTPIEKNVKLLNLGFAKSQVFDENYRNDLYPLYDLRLSMESSLLAVSQYLADFKGFTKEARIGSDLRRQENFPMTKEDIFSALNFGGIGAAITSLRKIKFQNEGAGDNSPPPSAEINTFRTGNSFTDAVLIATNLSQDLKIFLARFKSFVSTLRYLKEGNAKKLREQFFFHDFLEQSLDADVVIIDVRYFFKTSDKLDVTFELATHTELIEYTKFINIQYYNRKLAEDYYSKADNDGFFLLNCITDTICYPVPTSCGKALHNESIYSVLTDCKFVASSSEYDLIPGLGLVINKETKDKDIQKVLKDQNISPKSYPCLLEFSGCVGLNGGELKMCFDGEKNVIYSQFQNQIFEYINPMWYNSLVGYFKDFPLYIFFLFSLTFYFLVTFCCYKTKEKIQDFRDKKGKEQEGNKTDAQKETSPKSDRRSRRSKPSAPKRSGSPRHEQELSTLFSPKRD